MPAGWAAAAAAVVGGVMQSEAAGDAADSQANAAQNANDLQLWFRKQTRDDLAPWLQGGGDLQGNLNYLLGIEPGGTAPSSAQVGSILGMGKGSLLQPFDISKYQESPNYQFNLAEGRKAIDKAANARGRYYAPQTLQDIAKYSQGLASNEWQNAYNNYNTNMGTIFSRLQSIGNMGQNSAVQVGSMGQNTANQMGNNITGAGNAQAAGIVGQSNALSGGIGNALQAYQTQQIIGNNQKPTWGSDFFSAGNDMGVLSGGIGAVPY